MNRVRGGAPALRVALLPAGAGAPPHAGEVLSLTVQGCGGRFPEQGMPEVTPGERVRLEFSALLLLEPLPAEAIVRRIDARSSERGRELLIGFEFADPQAVARLVPYVLRPLFDRRRYDRAEVEEPVEVELDAPGLAARGRLRQISVGGAGVAVPLALTPRLGRGARLALRTRLPGSGAELALRAEVRGLWRDGSWLGCSLRFEHEDSADFARQESAIRDFVARRHRAELEGTQA